jgi:hypothetical protein
MCADLWTQLRIDVGKDWSAASDAQCRNVVRRLAGVVSADDLRNDPRLAPLCRAQETKCLHCRVASEQADYVVTVDALTKMLDILQRVTCGQPAVIMGDTGCGKSALVQQLCALVQAPLRTLNMHGGMDEADVASWLRRTLAECAALRPWLHDGLFFIFLDEVNTCDCLGLVKEVTCDRMLDGTPLPAHVAIVAACNPYRCRHPCSSGPIAMEDLVYVFAARGVLVVTCSCPPPTSLCNACSP